MRKRVYRNPGTKKREARAVRGEEEERKENESGVDGARADI